MLTRDEEQRLAAVLGVAKHDRKEDVIYASEYTVETVLWLAEKLKEVNDDLKVAWAELKRITEVREKIVAMQKEVEVPKKKRGSEVTYTEHDLLERDSDTVGG